MSNETVYRRHKWIPGARVRKLLPHIVLPDYRYGTIRQVLGAYLLVAWDDGLESMVTRRHLQVIEKDQGRTMQCWCGGEDGEHNDDAHAQEGR